MIKSCVLTIIGGVLFLAALLFGTSLVSAQSTSGNGSAMSGQATEETFSDATRRIWNGLWSGANLSFDEQTESTTAAQGNTPANTAGAIAAPAPTATGRYVALGDSVAAGLGLGVTSENSLADQRCGRSAQAYPYLVAEAKQLDLTHAACSGATAGDLITPQGVSGPNISRQISTVFANGQPDLITVTAGANDSQWSRFIYKCYQLTCGTSTDTTIANSALVVLQAKLSAFFSELKLRSDGGQPPQTIMTGYYNPLSANCNAQTQQLSSAELAWIEANVSALNQTIKQVTEQFSFASFAPVDFSGHDICSADPWVQGLTDQAPIHPTVEGQRVIANAVLAASR